MKQYVQTSGAIGCDSHAPLSHRIANMNKLKWILLIIPLLYVILIMGISVLNLFKRSIIVDNHFSMEYITMVLTEPVYLKVLFLTFKTGLIVTFSTLILAYPVAFLSIRTKSKLVKSLITSGVLVPFWISMLVRIFSWQIILQDQGIINKILLNLNIISEPIPLVYNTVAVVISMTHILFPYMFLSLQSVMEGINPNLMSASQSMGAKPWKSFCSVFLPLSVPGILSGSLIVFVLSIGFYIAPALLGGSSDLMMSNMIQTNIGTTLNWNLAAALSVELFVVTIVLMGIAYMIAGKALFASKLRKGGI